MSRQKNVFNALPIVAAHYGEKFGVKVVIGGSQATTDGQTIIVPNVPESYPNKDVVWGYLAHESGHVRYTNYPVWNSVPESDAMRIAVLNVLEDFRIENAMMQQYPGVRSDLDAAVTFLKQAGLFAVVTPADEPGRVLQSKLSFWLRANLLQQPVEDLAEAADNAMQEVFPEGVNTRLGVLLRKATTVSSTQDCLNLTDKILSMLQDEAEKEKEKENGNSQPDDDSSENDHDQETKSSDQGSDGGDPAGDGDAQTSPGNGTDDLSNQAGGSGSSQDSSHTGQTTATDTKASKNASDQILKALNSSADDLDSDAFESLKAELCQEADQNGDDSYCTVPTAPSNKGDAAQGRELLSQVQSTTSKLKSQLLGLVQATRQNRDFARRNGRKLDTKRVSRILTGDTRIFRNREDRVQANTAVHVLTDLSGSMKGPQEIVAREASLAIALALEAIPGVSPAVTYFCGSSQDPVRSAVRHGQPVKRNAERFVQSSNGSTPMAEGIWYAAFELSKMGESRKLMIVITDGDPDKANACHTVLDLCRNAGIETVGIGICHQNVKNLFDRSIIINSVNELRTTLFQLMRDKLVIEAA